MQLRKLKTKDAPMMLEWMHDDTVVHYLRQDFARKTIEDCLSFIEEARNENDSIHLAIVDEHDEYSIYEANVDVMTGDGSKYPFLSSKHKSGTYSKDMFLTNQTVPITQTTGMFLRNSIFINGIPEIMEQAVGTRSERSFEGDTGRFIMHLKEGLAYYDSRVVGVYRQTENGIWTSLSTAKKQDDFFLFVLLNTTFRKE